jgi:hypothetical protein
MTSSNTLCNKNYDFGHNFVARISVLGNIDYILTTQVVLHKKCTFDFCSTILLADISVLSARNYEKPFVVPAVF